MEEKIKFNKNKSRNKVLVMLVAIFLVMVVGVSFALWQLTFTQTGTNVITTGCLKLTLTEDTDAINLTDATPTSNADGKTLDPFTFTLENVCTTETAYVVNLETVSSGDKILADNYVKANLVSGENELFLDNLKETHINEEKVIEEASVAYKLHQGKLGNKEKLSFSLRLWMDEATPADDAVMDALWQGKITVTATYVPPVSMKGVMIPLSIEESNDDSYGYVKNNTYFGGRNNEGMLLNSISVEFQDKISPYSNAEEVVDFSVNQDRSVLGYYIKNDDATTYTLYIQTNGKIKVNPIASYYGVTFRSYYDQGAVSGLENLDTSLVTNMSYMFYEAYVYTGVSSENQASASINLNHFDTSNVTNMGYMFYNFSNSGTLEIDTWDMSNVTDMSHMFEFCRGITTTINITNPNIEKYESIFYNAATNEGAQITVNYTEETSDLVDRMIATKSSNSNVVKGSLIS